MPVAGEVGFRPVVRHQEEVQKANRDRETLSAVDGSGLTPSDMFRTWACWSPWTRLTKLTQAPHQRRIHASHDYCLVESVEGRYQRIHYEVVARGSDVVDFVDEIAFKQLLYFERYAKGLAPAWPMEADPALTANMNTERQAVRPASRHAAAQPRSEVHALTR
jgi:hypothetical protein